MASAKEYAYYIEGNKVAIIERDTAFDNNVDSKEYGPGVVRSNFKSPQSSVTDGLEIKYAQTDTLGEKNTTDYLSIMVNAGAGTDICIGRLKAGEAIMLPTRGGLATNNIMVSSTNGSGSAGANTIAVEFLAIT